MILWPLYIERLGGTPVDIGILAAAGGIALGVVLIPGGWLSDRVDRRRILLIGAAMAVPAPFLFVGAPHWQWLIPGVLLFHGSGFSRPAAQAVVQAEAPRWPPFGTPTPRSLWTEDLNPGQNFRPVTIQNPLATG